MKPGDLVRSQWMMPSSTRCGVVVSTSASRDSWRPGGPEDQATIQVMWSDMKVRWECPLDIEVLK
jgi:hypothetical protein